MVKQDINILIVEDDASMGKAIHEALKRAGYKAQLTADTGKAAILFERTRFHCAIIDCMLPGLNGVDLAKSFRQSGSPETSIILISGIYKDRQFKKEAIRVAGAKAFLVKPFDLEELVELVDESFYDSIDEPRSPLYDLLTAEDISNSQRIRAINSTECFNGLDLPLVYSTLFQGSLSGQLELRSSERNLEATVSFRKGRLQRIRINDEESYFGVLLVEKGLTSSEEVEEGLSIESDKPIGERLVDINSLSPHAIQIVNKEQLLIRLSKTVGDWAIEAQFTECKVEGSDTSVGPEEFRTILQEWILSKFSSDWLKTFYTPWMTHKIIPGPHFDKMNLYKQFDLVPDMNELTTRIKTQPSVENFVHKNSLTEEILLRVLHFFLLNRSLNFGNADEDGVDEVTRVSRLKGILQKMDKQDHFEILGISKEARKKDVQAAYHEYAKIFHPDRVGPAANSEVRNLSEKIFNRLNEAHHVLSDSEQKNKYKKTLEMGYAEEVLANEQSFDLGQNLLHSGKYSKALEVLGTLRTQRGHPSDTLIYYLWALIKVGWSDKNAGRKSKEVEALFRTIPPEDRHNPTYFFVRGLFKLALQDYSKGKTYLMHTIKLNPNFLPAKRELVALAGGSNTEKTVLTDLSSAFTGIFKKRSS